MVFMQLDEYCHTLMENRFRQRNMTAAHLAIGMSSTAPPSPVMEWMKTQDKKRPDISAIVSLAIV